jgi:hypothetical protein
VEASVAFSGEATLDTNDAPCRGGPRRRSDIYPLLSRTSTLSLSLICRLSVVAGLGGPATLSGEEQRGSAQRAPDEAVPRAPRPDDAWRSE